MHFIPKSHDFCAELYSNELTRHAKQEEGTLPKSYADFVDNLFKELALVDIGAVRKLLEEHAGMDDKVSITDVLRALDDLDGPNASAMHAAIGCAGEGGELLDCVKKVFIYGKQWDQVDAKTGDTPLGNLLEELADFRFYYQKLLNMLCITDQDVINKSYAKLSVRYASGRYSDAQAQARADK